MEKVERPLGPLVVDIKGTQLTEEEAKVLQHPMVGMVTFLPVTLRTLNSYRI